MTDDLEEIKNALSSFLEAFNDLDWQRFCTCLTMMPQFFIQTTPKPPPSSDLKDAPQLNRVSDPCLKRRGNTRLASTSSRSVFTFSISRVPSWSASSLNARKVFWEGARWYSSSAPMVGRSFTCTPQTSTKRHDRNLARKDLNPCHNRSSTPVCPNTSPASCHRTMRS